MNFDALVVLDATQWQHVDSLRDDGLFCCTRCGCGEGGLPTDCPGYKVLAERAGKIYNGVIDFLEGRWISGDGQMPCVNHKINIRKGTT